MCLSYNTFRPINNWVLELTHVQSVGRHVSHDGNIHLELHFSHL